MATRSGEEVASLILFAADRERVRVAFKAE
jgi:hypothetical protein